MQAAEAVLAQAAEPPGALEVGLQPLAERAQEQSRGPEQPLPEPLAQPRLEQAGQRPGRSQLQTEMERYLRTQVPRMSKLWW